MSVISNTPEAHHIAKSGQNYPSEMMRVRSELNLAEAVSMYVNIDKSLLVKLK
jgi:hypothetical protein